MHVLTHSKYACLARLLALKTGEGRWELTGRGHLIKWPRGKGTITSYPLSINYLCWPLERQHFRLSLLSLSQRSRYTCSLLPVQSPRQLALSLVWQVCWKLRCLLQWLYGSQTPHKHCPRTRRTMKRSRLPSVGGIILLALQQDYRQPSDIRKYFCLNHFFIKVSLTCAELCVYCPTCVWSQHTLNADTVVWPRDQIRDLITCTLDKLLDPQSPVRREQTKNNLRGKRKKLNFKATTDATFSTILNKAARSCLWVCVCTGRARDALGHSVWLGLQRGHSTLKRWKPNPNNGCWDVRSALMCAWNPVASPVLSFLSYSI